MWRIVRKPGIALGGYILACAVLAVRPANAANITEYPLDTPHPISITVSPDSKLWVGHFHGSQTVTGTPTDTPVTILDTQGNMTKLSEPGFIQSFLARSDGNMWFLPGDGSKTIDHISTAGQQLTAVVAAKYISALITADQSKAQGLNLGPTTVALQPAPTGSDGKIDTTNLPGVSSITEGPDHALWYSLSDGTVGRMDDTGNVQQFQIKAFTPTTVVVEGRTQTSDSPGGGEIAAGPDGALWIVAGTSVYRMTTDGQSSGYKGYVFDQPTGGPDGAMWFLGGPQSKNPDCSGRCLDSTKYLSRMTSDGKVTTYTVNGNPTALIAGKNSDLWYTENVVTGSSTSGPIQYGAIGHITTSGVVTDYKISDTDSRPDGLTLGPDGNVWFIEDTGQKVGVLSLNDNSDTIPVHISGVYSTTQAAKNQSFLRIMNTDSYYSGTVTVTLYSAGTGETLGQWVSPSISPGTAKQFAVATIEANTTNGGIQNRPAMYTMLVQPQFKARLQHIIWNPNAGILSNLSMCSRGTDNAPTLLSNVHTSINGDQGYPSSVVITNTGGIGQSVTLIVSDGDTGKEIGEYVSPLVPKNGQLTVDISTVEAALHFKPQPSQIYYIITAKQPFTGYLQHLVTNVQSNSVITDMSTACVIQPGIG